MLSQDSICANLLIDEQNCSEDLIQRARARILSAADPFAKYARTRIGLDLLATNKTTSKIEIEIRVKES